MVVWQFCVVCGATVDVDNSFGSIGQSETFCHEHEKIRLALVEIEKIGHEIHSLKFEYDNAYKTIRRMICIAESTGINKASYDKMDEKLNE